MGTTQPLRSFVSAVNGTLKTDANGDIWLIYNQLKEMTAHVRNNARLALTGQFAIMVGFDKRGDDNKEYRSSVTRRFGSWISCYVFVHRYCFEPQLVGDSKVSLLKVVKCSGGEFGDNVNINFPNLQYVPVNVKWFRTVEIDIKDDTQEKVREGDCNTSFQTEKISIIHITMRHMYIPDAIYSFPWS